MSEDKEITCETCGKKFSFTEREQTFFAEKEFVEPKRCHSCRKRKLSGSARKPFNLENFIETIEDMLSQYGFPDDEGDFSVEHISGEKVHTVVAKIKQNDFARVLLYNKGSISRIIREYVNSVAEVHGIKIDFSVKKDF